VIRNTRVRKRAEFERIQGGGARVTTRSFVLVVAARPDRGPARLGITASRKIGGAVTRNRAKRLVREAFRAHPELFPPGIDIVVICRKPPGAMKAAEVAAEWLSAAKQLARRIDEARTACETPPGTHDEPQRKAP
jgi:ribonuclease P protein component